MDSMFAIGTFGIVTAYIIESLKRTPFVPFIRADTKIVNRWVGVIALTHNGLHARARWSA